MASANQFRAEIWGVSHRHRPLRGDGEVPAATRASGAQRSVCASGWEGREEIGAEIIPKGVINLGQSLSHGCAVPAPFAQGSLGDGGCGLPRRPCGPPRNDKRFLSFRGAERRGNPSFLRWTGDGPPRSSAPTEGLPKSQQRADVPKAWLPPAKFRAEIWGIGQVVGPYGKPNQPPKPAGAQRSVRARVGEGWAGIGARTIPKGDRPRDHPGSA